MGRYLVVTNQTGDDLELKAALEVRGAGRRHAFFIVVAAVPPRHEPSAWSFGYGIDEGLGGQAIRKIVEADDRGRAAERIGARRKAQARLAELCQFIRGFGAHADGLVTDEDPVGAVHEALADRHVDEMIVAPAPTPFAQRLRRGLSIRLAALSDAPVTTIQPGAAPSAEFDGNRPRRSLILRRRPTGSRAVRREGRARSR